MTVRAAAIAAMSAVAVCACHPASGDHVREDHMNKEYTILMTAAGAARLYDAS
jgi:hypothetical protein